VAHAIKLQDIVIQCLNAQVVLHHRTVSRLIIQSVIALAGRNESREPYAAVLGNRLDQAALQRSYGFDVAEKDIALICNFET
jgi:hypothetical protein